jgi:multidrug transporter EmrE-like cation transporter
MEESFHMENTKADSRRNMTNIHPVILLIIAGFMNAAGTAVIKYSSIYKGLENSKIAVYYLLFVGTLALYGASFPFFATALGRMKLSVGQPVFSATTFLVSTLVSLLLLKESISFLQGLGMVVIIAGIVMVLA